MEDKTNHVESAATTTTLSEEYFPPPLPSIVADDTIDDSILFPSDGEMDTTPAPAIPFTRGADPNVVNPEFFVVPASPPAGDVLPTSPPPNVASSAPLQPEVDAVPSSTPPVAAAIGQQEEEKKKRPRTSEGRKRQNKARLERRKALKARKRGLQAVPAEEAQAGPSAPIKKPCHKNHINDFNLFLGNNDKMGLQN